MQKTRRNPKKFQKEYSVDRRTLQTHEKQPPKSHYGVFETLYSDQIIKVLVRTFYRFGNEMRTNTVFECAF